MSNAEQEGFFETIGSMGLFGVVVILSALPGVLYLVGIKVETGAGEYRHELLNAISGQVGPWDYGLVRGAMAYTMLEWSVVLLAMAIAVLAYAHFHARQESISLIIGVAAFWTGAITAFHLLAFHGFSLEVVNPSAFVQFNWTVGQGFTALLLVGASVLVLWRGNRRERFAPWHLAGLVVACSALAYAIIYVTAQAPTLPQFSREGQFISRPFDLIPLVIFAIGAAGVLPMLHRLCRTPFSLALWFSSIPLMASQLYMAVPSQVLFDAGFTSAQLAKTMAFAIIFAGLAWDYARTCRREHRFQRKLSVSDRRIRMLFDNAAEAIILFEPNGSIRAWNQRATEICGWTTRQVRGRDIAEILFRESDESTLKRQQFRSRLNDHVEDGGEESLKEFREEIIYGPDGQEVTIEYSVVATSEQGETIFALLARDITERKQLQLRMFQMDRLVAAGTLAAGVVHEIKNPMTYVVTNLNLAHETIDTLRQDWSDGDGRPPADDGQLRTMLDDSSTALKAADDGCERVQRIIDDMRVFSRTGNGKTKAVCIRETVEIAIRMTRGKIQKQAAIETDFQSTPMVKADKTRLSQVFVNLMVNAAQAMADAPSEEDTIFVQIKSVGEQVVVRFRDTGPGMSESVKAKIFQPFFTTKTEGEGTGLGLTLSKSIIEGFGGDIDVESTPGEGTTFEVRLPGVGR